MYEEFNYITDENFLTTYWKNEKILCPYCKGTGQLSFDSEEEMVSCHLCHETGWVTNKQYTESLCLSAFPDGII